MFLNIAVDGPAGSGKSTVAKEIAKILKITYLDTGAMYRMVTLDFLNNNIQFDNLDQIKERLETIKIEFKKEGLFLNDENVTDEIRNDIVANHVSQVAAIGPVRIKMVEMQQEIAKGQNIIMDGRDIGTHVLKDASYKFYLVASVEERAQRRMKDFVEQGIKITMEQLIDDIEKRDYQDMNREISPLRQADDAILVDTTKMNIEEVIKFIIKEIK